jgi:hypothetical protein
MLFSDGSPSTVEHLRGYESEITTVARVEGIDLDGKLRVAAEEVGDNLLAYLLTHPLADPQAGARRTVGLSTVVVTPSMRRWHTLHTLALTYRDAFHNQRADRYAESWKQYVEAAAEARKTALRIGVGLVNAGVPKAPKPTAGIAVGSWVGETYVVRAAWVNGGGQEGAAGEAVSVTLTELSAPLALLEGPAPGGVVGWHVYAGTLDGQLMRQTAAPWPVGQAWIGPGSGLIQGPGPSEGQEPELWVLPAQTF